MTPDETGRTLGWKVMLGTARMMAERGEFEKAEEFYRRALESATARLGDSDPVVVKILMDFAAFYRQRGEAATADGLIFRAHSIDPSRSKPR